MDFNLDIFEDFNIILVLLEFKIGFLFFRVGILVLKLKRFIEDEIKYFSFRKGDVGFGILKGDGVLEGSSSFEKSL